MQLALHETLDRNTCSNCREGEYRKCAELNYYGADVNKYIDKECSREMTYNNIDCLGYKRSKKILRVIESKHSKEGMRGTQREVLRVVAKLFTLLNKTQSEYKCEIYIITGDYPYSDVLIEDLLTGKNSRLNNEKFKQFLEFNLNTSIEEGI